MPHSLAGRTDKSRLRFSGFTFKVRCRPLKRGLADLPAQPVKGFAGLFSPDGKQQQSPFAGKGEEKEADEQSEQPLAGQKEHQKTGNQQENAENISQDKAQQADR